MLARTLRRLHRKISNVESSIASIRRSRNNPDNEMYTNYSDEQADQIAKKILVALKTHLSGPAPFSKVEVSELRKKIEGEGEGEAKKQKCLTTEQSEIEEEEEGEGEANMSWHKYLHEQLMREIEGTGNYLSSSAIIIHGGKIMAKSSNFPMLKPGQISLLSRMINNFQEGYRIIRYMSLGDTTYTVQGERDLVIHGRYGLSGVTVKKTCEAFVIGIYDEPVTQAQCSLLVEATGDHLIRNGK